MDKKFRVNTNGERDIWSTAEETPETATFRRGGTQSQPPQMQQQPSSQFHQPESSHQRVSNGFLSDLQTLESSFGGLSFSDSTVRQNGQPMPPNRYNQVINGGGSGVVGGGNGYMPPLSVGYYQREFEEIPRFNRMQQRLSVQNDCSNRSSYDTYGLLNNGFLNGVSYSSRNHVSDQNPWDHSNGFGTGMNNLWMGFGYNHDQALAANWREPPSILSMAKDKDLRDHLLMTLLGPQERVDVIFNALIAHLFDLMVDSHANDVVRRLMDKCSPEQIIQILDMVTQSQSQFVNLCFDPLGTKAMQSLVINIRLRCGEDQILRFLGAITMVALRLSRSSNAKEVILECFCQFTFLQCRHLVEVVAGHCYQIAIDQHGCCLIQQCFNNKRPMPFQIRQRFISEIITHALKLCLNCYGNYVVQYVVELENQQVTEALVVQLLGSYAYLARNKYGSHAVQKLLQLKSINTRLIVNDLVQEIDTLLVDPFGNYVIQTAWFVSKDDVRHMLKWHIERNIRLMRCNKFGNKILERLNL